LDQFVIVRVGGGERRDCPPEKVLDVRYPYRGRRGGRLRRQSYIFLRLGWVVMAVFKAGMDDAREAQKKPKTSGRDRYTVFKVGSSPLRVTGKLF